MLTLKVARAILSQESTQNAEIQYWSNWLAFRAVRQSNTSAWVYVVSFSEAPEIFAWGIVSDNGDQLKSTGLFHEGPEGHCETGVDYMMLKRAYGGFKFHIFEIENKGRAQEIQNRLCEINEHKECFVGLGAERKEILQNAFQKFQGSQNWRNVSPPSQMLYTLFVTDVLMKKSHGHGEIFEPGVLDRSGLDLYIPAIEEALQIQLDREGKVKTA